MRRIERIRHRIGVRVEERHRAGHEAERAEHRFERMRAEAMSQRGWI
jgi:hypothetical protein